MTDKKQISIRLSPDLYQWLTEKVSSIKPETSINNYVVYLIEQEKDKLELVDSSVKYRTRLGNEK